MLWRQGDLLIEDILCMPTGSFTKQRRLVLAEGQSTGHRHQIRNPKAGELYANFPGRVMYLKITDEEAVIEHPEHRPITLKKGIYRVWRQREFGETSPRAVID